MPRPYSVHELCGKNTTLEPSACPLCRRVELRDALATFIRTGSANGREDLRAQLLRPSKLEAMAMAAS